MNNPFTHHPSTVDETYFEHLGSALSFAGPLLIATFCCLTHALLPFLFEKTGSKIVTRLHDRMVTNRHRLKDHDADVNGQNPEMA